MEIQNSKKVRGSAFTDAEGCFIFRPYASSGERTNGLKQVKVGRFSTLTFGKKNITARMSFDCQSIPPFLVWMEEFTEMYKHCTRLTLHSPKKFNYDI